MRYHTNKLNNDASSTNLAPHTGRSLLASLKIAAVVLVCAGALAGLGQVGSTMSVYIDTEESRGNLLKADPLEFSVLLDATTLDMSAGEQTIVPAMQPSTTSEPVQYFVQSQVQTDAGLCSMLNVLTTAPFVYDGPLLLLQSQKTLETGPWALTFSLAAGATSTPGASCRIDLVYTGWNADSESGQGYMDIERVPLLLYMGTSTPTTTQEALPLPPEVEGTSTIATSSVTDTSPDTPHDEGGTGGGGGASAPEPQQDTATSSDSSDDASDSQQGDSSAASSTPPTTNNDAPLPTSDTSSMPEETNQTQDPITTPEPTPVPPMTPPSDPMPPPAGDPVAPTPVQ